MMSANCVSNEGYTVAFPIKIGSEGRYFVDQNSRPFLVHADTGWKLFWEFTKPEAELYLENRKQKGYTAIQVQMLPHKDYQANRNGDTPFLVRGDMKTPNPAYFEHVDWVIGKAMEKGIGLLISPAWASSWEQDWYKHLNMENAEAYTGYLADRYKGFKNIIGWIHGGDDDALALHDTIRICGRVMKERAPHQLNTFHGCVRGGWQFFNDEPWYDFNMAYAYDYIEMLRQMEEAYGLSPAKPVFLGETHYEYNLGITSAQIRKYAYTSILLGAAGQTYGNKDIWIATCFWIASMDSPGSGHMAHIAKMLNTLHWEKLVPDYSHAFVTEGYGAGLEFAPAACAGDGSVAMVYIPSARSVIINRTMLDGGIKAYWFDPTSGMYIDAGMSGGQEYTSFRSPGKNMDGDEDWILLFKC